MNYELRHKNERVANLQFDSEADVEDFELVNPRLSPVLSTDRPNLPAWIRDRAIPEGRSGLSRMLEEAGCKNPNEYLVRNLGLSLDDSYWICPKAEAGLRWEDVNLYDHPSGKVLTFHSGDTRSPAVRRIRTDSALNGSLKKDLSYRSEDNSWYLVKCGDPKIPNGLQNINEAFAALLHKRQGFPDYVSYTLRFDEHGSCTACVCRYFTDRNHELIHAGDVIGGENGMPYDAKQAIGQYIDFCVSHGLKREKVQSFMDYMTLTDFLLTNTDRHWENFGILRNPETLEVLSPAPIYDSGTSMLCRDPYVRTRTALLQIPCNGIDTLYQNTLRLVQDKTVVDPDRLPKRDEVQAFYLDRGVPEGQAKQIALCFDLKKDMLIEFQMGYTVSISNEFLYGTEPPVKCGVKNPDYRPASVSPTLLVVSVPDSELPYYQSRLVHPLILKEDRLRDLMGYSENNLEIENTAFRQIRQALREGKDVLYQTREITPDLQKQLEGLRKEIPGLKLQILPSMKEKVCKETLKSSEKTIE